MAGIDLVEDFAIKRIIAETPESFHKIDIDDVIQVYIDLFGTDPADDMGMNRGGIIGYAAGGPAGLYANIHAKRKRIKAGSGEKMRQVGSQGAPTQQSFIDSAKTAKKAGGGIMDINRMTAPLGYAAGGPAGMTELERKSVQPITMSQIMADMKASRGPAEVTHPIQKIISDRIPVSPYSVSQKERAKELGLKGLEGIRSLFGAKAAGASELGDMLDTYIPILKAKIIKLEADGLDATGEKNWLEYYEDLRRRQD